MDKQQYIRRDKPFLHLIDSTKKGYRYHATCWTCQRPILRWKRARAGWYRTCSPTCRKKRSEILLWDRFWAHVKQEGGCWIWQGKISHRGYALVSAKRQWKLAHVLLHTKLYGPLPSGLERDHLCKRTACIHPGHLEAVTRLENIRRASKAQQTHCKHGHPFDEHNTYRTKDGRRLCKQCSRIRQRQNHVKVKHYDSQSLA